MKKEVIITGFGGQGIVLAGKVLGNAAAIGDNRESTLVQSYGPESRGGACSAQVIISDSMIHYPYIRTSDVLVAMSQSGYEKYIPQLKKDGMLLYDQDLVQPAADTVQETFAIPATRLAEEIGRKMMANIIMIGFITSVTQVVTLDAAKNTVEGSVPKGTEKMNLDAFGKGYDFGISRLKGLERKASGRTGAMS
jgi:2-oxoglutarate ferredoxin oxidoreductase subunit gamma